MPITHVAEIGAENSYQKTGTINSTGMKIDCPIRYRKPVLKNRYQIACQTLQKPVVVFWYGYRRRFLVPRKVVCQCFRKYFAEEI